MNYRIPKFEFQVNNDFLKYKYIKMKLIFKIIIHFDILRKKIIAYLKFTFSWVACVFFATVGHSRLKAVLNPWRGPIVRPV